MASFKLNSVAKLVAQRPPQDHVRMGTISLFALVIIISLAVLSVLSLSTANASLFMSQRQATAMHELYADEVAAQEFIAQLDAVISAQHGAVAVTKAPATAGDTRTKAAADKADGHGERGERAVQAVKESLGTMCEKARQAAEGKVEVFASMVRNEVYADFSCENGRVLNVVVTVRSDATYRIDKWKMSAVQNEEEPQGQLLIVG